LIELTGQPAEIGMTIHVTRKETGVTETYELIGKVINEDLENGSNTQHSSTECGNGCSHGTTGGIGSPEI
jgi:hypothetical protein